MTEDNHDKIAALVETIKRKINIGLEDGGYKIENTHFENGRNLHSEQYYFAKRFFQNTENSEELSQLLKYKLEKINKLTTLVGFRNYTGLALNNVVRKLNDTAKADLFNYSIIEHDDTGFIWQYPPQPRDNIIIILPITCTCSTYIKLRKFINDYLRDLKNEHSKVSDEFINVFLILEKSLQYKESETIEFNESKDELSHLYNLYSAFNWMKITPDEIFFNSKSSTVKSVIFTANSLIRLYSELYLPESCPFCFPEERPGTEERLLFPTHDNFETPNLIFGFPNFNQIAPNQRNFYEIFGPGEHSFNTHLYGHISVNDHSYMNYIRGNAFYEKNRGQIIDYFNGRLQTYLEGNNDSIIFITAESKHNSNFLGDISLSSTLAGKSVTILRFQQENEFIDNFISLHGKVINEANVKLIYFEEVMSAGKTFKLISNYIRHSRNNTNKDFEHYGFDLVMTLVDRMPLFTKNEVLKKISAAPNRDDVEARFIFFYKLNVPIIDATHLGDPLKRRNDDLNKMVEQCHLDGLKMIIGKEIENQLPKKLPEIDIQKKGKTELNYFPFANIEEKINDEIFQLYTPYRNKENMDLLKLYLAHEINTELSGDQYQEASFFSKYQSRPQEFISWLIKRVYDNIKDHLGDFFFGKDHYGSPLRKIEEEYEIIHDTIVKMLSRYPFIYYRNIYEAIFKYCMTELDQLHSEIEKGAVKTFKIFRKLKFYIRRSLDLNSSFIISERFLECIKQQYSRGIIDDVISHYAKVQRQLESWFKEKKVSESYYKAAQNNIKYKSRQVSSYFSYLLFCYKELVYKNPSRSIKLEKIINSAAILPDEINEVEKGKGDLEKLLWDPYFHFTGMIKAENIYLLSELKELHKHNLGYPDFTQRNNYRKYYFKPNRKNDSVIINAQKLIANSRHAGNKKKHDEIITSACNMLHAVKALEETKSRKTSDVGLNSDIRKVLNTALKILQPGIPEDSLKYAFFVEYRNRRSESLYAENVYAILSDEKAETPENISISSEGFIYRFLCGLTDSQESGNTQTLISAIKMDNGRYVSFNNHYYYGYDDEGKCGQPAVFDELFHTDVFDRETGEGLKMLNTASMCIAIRLARLKKSDDPDIGDRLEGQAVLLIVNTQPCTAQSFLNFMSNEKVRLLLLLKEELLNYLTKQFDNDSFSEVLENRKRFIYQRHLRHGTNNYLVAQDVLVKEILKGHDVERNARLFQIVTDAIRGQLKATKIIDIDVKAEITCEMLMQKLRLIIECEMLGHRPIDFSEVEIRGLNFEIIRMHPVLFDTVIPELLINMKKYCPLVGNKKLRIGYDKNQDNLSFSNAVNTQILDENYEGGLGIKMCNDILKKVNLQPLYVNTSTDKSYYSVFIKLKP